MMSERPFVVNLSCEDRPGIVAAVTTELAAFGANIAESNQFWDRQTNRFFMRIAFNAPNGINREDIERNLQPVTTRFDMKVALTDRSLRNHERAEKPQTIVIDQKDFRFDPETVAIRAGDLVKFTNSDNAVHNVRTINPLHSFNVNMQSGGKHEEKFDRASGIRRPYRLGCDYHSSMRAWVFVFAHPYFQVTKADGKFRLDDVPPGDYDLEMAHPAGELKWTQKIKVTSGETTKIDIQVSPDDKTDAKQ